MPRKYVRVKPLKEKPVEKPKEPKFNIKYVNNEGEVLHEGNYLFIKDSLEDLRKICPVLCLRRLRTIQESRNNDSLNKYILISRIKQSINEQPPPVVLAE